MQITGLILISYLLGSIPFGLIIAKAHGVNLRSIGSGNIGATNLSRALGKKWAYVCFFLDVFKGFAPTFAAKFILETNLTPVDFLLWLCVGCAAVFGHIFPIYVNFKGGKGVATSLGIGLGLYPYYTIAGVVAFISWAIIVLISKYVSLSSIIASFIFLVALIASIIILPEWQFKNLWPLLSVAIFMPIMITIRHRENIKRLIAGTENKVFTKKS